MVAGSSTGEGAHWIFGYGSLIWKQDFPFLVARRASVKGWSRRFWQGSHDHRGVPRDPGRVVTLVASPNEICIGRAFLVEAEVFRHLDHREKNGYRRHPVRIDFDEDFATGTTYIAAPGNAAFLGEAPLERVIDQVLRCRGESGSNIDYILELASALRELDVVDPHVAEIEAAILCRLAK